MLYVVNIFMQNYEHMHYKINVSSQGPYFISCHWRYTTNFSPPPFFGESAMILE